MGGARSGWHLRRRVGGDEPCGDRVETASRRPHAWPEAVEVAAAGPRSGGEGGGGEGGGDGGGGDGGSSGGVNGGGGAEGGSYRDMQW